LSPSWESLVTSWTPDSPRATRAQEAEPEGAVLARAEVQPENLALAGASDADRDDQRRLLDAVVPAHLQEGRVQPDVGVLAFEAPRAEALDLGV
jgi:hypothetical protein